MKKGAAWKGDDLVLEHEWEEAGRRFTMREVFSAIRPNSFTQTLYQGESGRELRRVVTIHANRGITSRGSAGGAVAENDFDAAVQAAKTIAIPAIRAHMRFLSDNLLEGRETGRRGHEIAALYVAAQLESMGVQPAGENGTYFQRVPLRKAINVGPKSSLVLFDRGKEILLKDEVDYVFGASLEHTESSIEAPVVFVGFGVSAPELKYDDYAGTDVRGKIVALLANAPARFSSTERAYYADGGLKAKNAVAHGAVGMLGLVLPEDEKISPWQWVVPQIQAGSREWLDKGVSPNSLPELRFAAALSGSGAETLFDGASHTLQEVFARAHAGLPQAFPLAWSARVHTVNLHQNLESRNVIGRIEGSDPALKSEYVIYSAHLDHLGLCPPVAGCDDKVCHGTLDNASGAATILEIMRAYTKLPKAPRRSMLFLFPTGEEGNLEGSDFFAHHPTVPANAMVADINMDVAPGLRYPSEDLNAIGAEHSSLSRSADWAAQLSGYRITPDPMQEQNFFIRSDHYSFVQQGIPAILIRNGSDGEEVIEKWLQTRYHTPLDNMDQPLYYEAGVKAAGMVFLLGYDVAQQDQRPRWNKGDFFGIKFSHKSVASPGQTH